MLACFFVVWKQFLAQTEPLINDLLNLWASITMHDISRPIGHKRFQFHGILAWTIHDAPGLTHFCGM